jgi:hypothetical protein
MAPARLGGKLRVPVDRCRAPLRHPLEVPFGMVKRKSDDEELSRLSTEHKAIREAVSTIIMAWAQLENTLAILLSKIINDPSGQFAFAIYFAPSNTETRIRIIDATFSVLISASKQHHQQIAAAWQTIRNTINRLKDTRNAVAHGHITTCSRYNRSHARLTPPMFNFKPFAIAHEKRQLPGLGSADINQSTERIIKINLALVDFGFICDALHRGDDLTSPEILRRISGCVGLAPD